jgi:H2-forming N5,N10-methylenetetrahydromethanopterin dehydrogenase-like enzyme
MRKSTIKTICQGWIVPNIIEALLETHTTIYAVFSGRTVSFYYVYKNNLCTIAVDVPVQHPYAVAGNESLARYTIAKMINIKYSDQIAIMEREQKKHNITLTDWSTLRNVKTLN